MNDIRIIQTGDGSASLLNTTLNETYHSIHGAMRESIHVFIDHGLNYFSEKNPGTPINILEVGFGTALNTWLTAKEVRNRSLRISYTSLETFPLAEEVWGQLHYAVTEDDRSLFSALHAAAWNERTEIIPGFVLNKVNQSLQQVNLTTTFEIIYFDAFAPNKQPEMWTFEMLNKVCRSLSPNGVFVTYCAKGQLKRDLRTIGLDVQTLPGPPGKKEMVRAVKPAS